MEVGAGLLCGFLLGHAFLLVLKLELVRLMECFLEEGWGDAVFVEFAEGGEGAVFSEVLEEGFCFFERCALCMGVG